MTKKLTLFISLLIIVSPLSANSNPIINSISGIGADGSTLSISGSGFGNHSLDIKWLGGPNGNTEKGTAGNEVSLPAGWTADTTSSARQRPQYSTTRAHGVRTKSMKSFLAGGQYTSGYYYDYGSAFASAYVTWWVYLTDLSCGGSCAGNSQWKIIRFTPGDPIYQDQQGNWYWPQQVAAPAATFAGGNYMFVNFCLTGVNYDSNCYAGQVPINGIYRSYGITEGKWWRVEVSASESGQSEQNGTVTITISDGTVVRQVVNYVGNTRTRSTTDRWRAVVFENYWGNGLGQATAYQNDHYLQFGTRARVEIGDSPTWSNCIHKEIQFPTAWSDNSITITGNQGSFATGGTVYLYVVDDKGNVNSQGYPVTIQKAVAPPSPPKGLRIIN